MSALLLSVIAGFLGGWAYVQIQDWLVCPDWRCTSPAGIRSLRR